MLSKKRVAGMTGGIIGQRLGRINVAETIPSAIHAVLSDVPADVLTNPNKQSLLCYAACGIIIQHTKNRQLYLEVMSRLTPGQAKKQAKRMK